MNDKKTALLLILHGSPRPEANEPAIELARRLADENRYASVSVAYLECNHPSIGSAIRECASLDIDQIIAIPYFLHTGRHLVLDIPNQLIEAGLECPHVTILMTDAVGLSPAITAGLAERADETGAANEIDAAGGFSVNSRPI